MPLDFAALRRAAAATRVGALTDATRIIQQALRGHAAPPAAPPVAPPVARDGRIDGEADIVTPSDAPHPAPRRAPFHRRTDAPRGRMRPAAPTIPEGARWLHRTFACAEGSRDYRLYLPATAPRGLILMLHGCKQDGDDFARGTGMNAVAEAHGLAVAYPIQQRRENASACWRWFEPRHQGRGTGEPAILAGLAQAVGAEFAVPAPRVFVAGLSAGGAMAAVLGEAYGDVFAAVGVHSGLCAGSATDVASAFAAMRGEGHGGKRPTARVIVFHGSADRTVHPANAVRLTPPSPPTRTSAATDGGRSCTRQVWVGPVGAAQAECWIVDGAGHAWCGGDASGSFTDPGGPDASAAMVRFFLAI